MKRRTFIKSAACASAVAVTAGVKVADARENASGIAGYDYRLPKLKRGATLLFQGDSITDMNWGRNQDDRNHYLGHSYVYLIASRLHTDMPASKLNFLARGNSGNTVPDLQRRWKRDALDLKPDVLSILIGVNDAGRSLQSGHGSGIDAYESGYRSLLDLSRKANADLKIVLLEPFVLPVGGVKASWKAWSDRIDRMRSVVAKLAGEYGAVLVKTQEVFNAAAELADPSHWIWDGVHPLPQGHELIARSWIEAVSEAWA